MIDINQLQLHMLLTSNRHIKNVAELNIVVSIQPSPTWDIVVHLTAQHKNERGIWKAINDNY